MNTAYHTGEPHSVPPAAADSPYYQRLRIAFSDDRVAWAVRAPRVPDIPRLLEALGLTPGTPALFVTGGAGNMDEAQMERTRPAVLEGLARFAADYGVSIVDGGTASGVMKLLGEAMSVSEDGPRFNLIGVVPIGAVCFPGYDNPDGVALDAGHTHFILADGEKFGDESDLIARVALVLAEGSQRRPFGVVINGGDIARQETYDRVLRQETAVPLLAFDGSGRFGDELAAAAQGAPTDDPRIAAIVQRAPVYVAPLERGPTVIYAELERLLTSG